MRRSPAEDRENTLERLMSAYGDPVMRTCLLFLQSRTLAEDASQETFIRAWRFMDRLKENGNEKAWLLAIAAHVCRSMLKSRAYRDMGKNLYDDESVHETGTPDEYPDDTIYKTVNALPVKYRMPVVLYYYQALSVKEIAGALRIPGTTVRTRISRARAQLQKELKGWFFDEE